MNKTKLICAALALSAAATASAGGILTNTNQNIAFLRNPAQDAVIRHCRCVQQPCRSGVYEQRIPSVAQHPERSPDA